MFLLDTDVLSQTGRSKPHPAVIRWLEDQQDDDIFTSTVSIEEIRAGIETVRQQDADLGAALERWITRIIAYGEPQILPVTTPAAILFARMRTTPQLKHFIQQDHRSAKPALGNDLRIAAIAIATGATIATGNVRHYMAINERFAIPGLYDPFTGRWHIRPEEEPEQIFPLLRHY